MRSFEGGGLATPAPTRVRLTDGPESAGVGGARPANCRFGPVAGGVSRYVPLRNPQDVVRASV